MQPTTMWMDNTGAVQTANEAGSMGRGRHIARRVNFLQDAHASGCIKSKWIPTEHLAADMLTKPLEKRRFSKLRAYLMNLDTCDTVSNGKQPARAHS